MNLNQYIFNLKLTTFLKLRLVILNLIIFHTSYIFSINIDDDRVDEFEGIEDYDAVVYVKVGNSVCTGALINYRTVLTAAHCLIEGQKVEIFYGSEINQDSLKIETSSFIKLPEDRRYSGFTGASFDLALISLSEPFTNIEPLQINDELPSLNSEVFISGYGLHGTGSNPDQDFDKKKRWGKNILSVLGRENSIAGQSLLNSKDKIILGFYFDQNVSSYESTISLGDSGSPLLLDEGNKKTIIGIASWISKNPKTLARGYGSNTGYASIAENIDWLNKNNPLRNTSSISNGVWENFMNWSEDQYPNNFVPKLENYNLLNSRYYSVQVGHDINVSNVLKIDSLNVIESGFLTLKQDSSLEILLDIEINQGEIENNGSLKGSNLFINNGVLTTNNSLIISDSIKLVDGKFQNNGLVDAKKIEVVEGLVFGDGIFSATSFTNHGHISPGTTANAIGSLEFKGELSNHGIISMDLKSSKENDVLFIDTFNLNGTLKLNPISRRYQGNSIHSLIFFNKLSGDSFNNIEVSNTNLGRLITNISVDNKSIKLKLLNPSFEALGFTERAKDIGKYLDKFSNTASQNFQKVLDEIIYTEIDAEASSLIDDLIIRSNFEYYIKSLEDMRPNKLKGIYITKGDLDIKFDSDYFKSNIKKIDFNYFNFNLAYVDKHSNFLNTTVNESSDSKGLELTYKLPFAYFESYISYYEESSDIEKLRNLDFNSKDIRASSEIEFEQNQISFIIEKIIEFDNFRIKPGLDYRKITFQTYPFNEHFDEVKTKYNYQDLDISSVAAFLEISARFNIKNLSNEIGFGITKYNYETDNLEFNAVIDNSSQKLLLEERLILKEDLRTTFSFQTSYKDRIFGKLKFSKKAEDKYSELKIGYYF